MYELDLRELHLVLTEAKATVAISVKTDFLVK